MARREYQGAATPTTITSSITNTATSLTITASTGWPTGVFSAVIDPGLAGEEKILCTSRSGTTVNITTRGYDGTTAAAHNAGATIYPVPTAIDFDEANAHINSTAGTTGIHGLTGALVGTTDTQTLTNKTLTTPAISNITAKGDLLTGTASTVLGVTAVGANGTVPMADSSAATGLSYQPLNSAGKNAIINGGMDIWQRGTSIALAASTAAANGYLADRWQTSTGVNEATTISRQATADTTNLPNIQYCMRYQRNSGQTGVGVYSLTQSIETTNSIPFVGKAVTFSFYARAGANYSATSNLLGASVIGGTGTDLNALTTWTGTTTPVSGSATLTTTWQRFSYTGTVASTVTQLALVFQYTPTGTAGVNDYFEVTGVQLELGSVATTFSRAGGTLQGELAACQRYYQRITSSALNGFLSGVLTATATTNVQGLFASKVTMRAIPTISDYATVSVSPDNISTGIAVTSVTVSGSTQTGDNIVLNFAVTGATQYRPYIAYASTAGGYIGMGAEL